MIATALHVPSIVLCVRSGFRSVEDRGQRKKSQIISTDFARCILLLLRPHQLRLDLASDFPGLSVTTSLSLPRLVRALALDRMLKAEEMEDVLVSDGDSSNGGYDLAPTGSTGKVAGKGKRKAASHHSDDDEKQGKKSKR